MKVLILKTYCLFNKISKRKLSVKNELVENFEKQNKKTTILEQLKVFTKLVMIVQY